MFTNLKKTISILLVLIVVLSTLAVVPVSAEIVDTKAEADIATTNEAALSRYSEIEPSFEVATKNTVNVYWEENEEAIKYEVSYKENRSDKFTVLTETEKTSYVVKLGPSKTYYFKVVAIDDENNRISEESENGYKFTFVKSVPVKGIKNTIKGISFKWNTVEDANTYAIFRANGKKEFKLIDTTDKTTYLDTNVKSGTTYKYYVRALNEEEKYISYFDTQGTSLLRLDTPKVKSVENKGKTCIVKWKKIEGATSYKVYRKVGNKKTWTKIGSTTTLKYKDKGFKNNKTYYYTVIAANKKTSSSYHDPSYVIKYLQVPKLNKVEFTHTNGKVKFSWKKVEGASKYVAYVKRTDTKSNWKRIGVTKSNSITCSNLKNQGQYAFSVRCLSNDGKTFESYYDTKGIKTKYFSVPKLKNVKSIGTGKVAITWNPVEGARYYRVYYKVESKTGKTTDWKVLRTAYANSTYQTHLVDGSTYYYTVRVIDANGKALSSFNEKGIKIKCDKKEFQKNSPYLIHLSYPDPDYVSYPIHLNDYDRSVAEHILMGEAGSMSFLGTALVCQSLRDAYVRNGCTSIYQTIREMGYTATLSKTPNQHCKDVVKFIFDQGGAVVEHRVLVFYASNICSSGWHESQIFIAQIENVRYFDMRVA